MSTSAAPLPDFTIVIEWENALDIERYWLEKALERLEAELERTQGLTAQRPRILYLFDPSIVRENDITETMSRVAPRIPVLCDLELVPAPGVTYYKLKNYGVKLAKTDFVVMLDSDAGPQEGWLSGLLRPFEDPEVMAVAGFTVLGYNNLASRTMALVWVFDLISEREKTVKKQKIHANNCAFRTEFFQANPWPDAPVFKKLTRFWLQDIIKRGIRWVRTADAVTIHSPHPGLRFMAWRAWAGGKDRDYKVAQYSGRVGRVGRALFYWLKKLTRSTWRILTKSREVELPVYQIPAALAIAWGYYTILAFSQVGSALFRSHVSLETLASSAQG
jgi:hypothetical protein